MGFGAKSSAIAQKFPPKGQFLGFPGEIGGTWRYIE